MTRRPFLQSVLAMLCPWKKSGLATATFTPGAFIIRLNDSDDFERRVPQILGEIFESHALATSEPKVAASVEEALRELMEDAAVMKGERRW